jgi:hypothetical protein
MYNIVISLTFSPISKHSLNSTMSNPPDLLTCEPSELAEYLLSERFENSSKATATFLLQSTACLPNAEELSAELMQGEDKGEELIGLGDPLSEAAEVAMIMPRGKLTCSLFEEGIHCVNAKKESFKILPQHTSQLVVFPKPEDIRKKGARDMVLLTLKEKVSLKNKELSQICFQLPNDTAFLENFRTALNLTKMARIGGNGWNFQSHKEGSTSTTTGGLPCVRCYHGVNDGHMFPLAEGLLFFKPPLFLPRSSLHSIACGRGASGSSRYVDMNIQLDDDDKTLEFTNIHREELGGLNDYLHKILIPAMKQDTVGDEKEDDSVDAVEEVEDDDDENDDDDTGASRRPSRKASKEAREATKSQMKTGVGEDDDSDDNWVSSKRKDDDDDDEDDENEDEDLGENDTDEGEVDDDAEEEVFFEEEEEEGEDDETEDEDSDNQEVRPAKKSRKG